jgi:hypothetical protein
MKVHEEKKRYTTKTHIRHYTGCLLLALILALFTQISVSYAAGPLLTWPVDSDGTMMRSMSADPLKPYELRKGQIALSPEIFPGAPGMVNSRSEVTTSKSDTDTSSISFFADVVYEVIIDSVKHQADGTMIISGKLKDHTMGTVVMTIGPEGFLITVQDMNRAFLYRAAGDSRQGSGSVTEIDMSKIPPMIR